MMIRLYSTKLLRRLKSAAKTRTQRSSRKSAGRKWWRESGDGAKRLWLFWLLINLAKIIGDNGSAGTWKIDLLRGMSFAFVGVSLSQANKMAALLTVSAERRVLWFYPFSEKDFFQWTALRFVARSTWIAVVAAAIYFVANRATEADGWAVRIAGPLAEWLIVLCIAIALVRHVAKLPGWLPFGFYALAGLMLFVPEPYGKAAAPLASVLPTGWLSVLMMDPRTKEWAGVAAIGTVLALGLLCWWLFRQLETLYCHQEAQAIEENANPIEVSPDAIDRLAKTQARAEEEMANELAMETESEAVLPIQAAWQKQKFENWSSAAEEVVRERQWLDGWNWNAMAPIERTVGWCLKGGEKGEAQFLLGPVPPNWSNRWRTAAIATAVGMAVAMTGTWTFSAVSILAFAVSIGAGMPVLGGAWAAANQGRISGKFSPIFGCYPLSYWTAGWIMFKANAVRTIAWLPLGLAIAVLNARITQTTIAASSWIMLRALLLFLGLMPILVSAKFSKVTNDTLNLRLKIIPILALFLVVIFVVVTFGACVFMVDGRWPPILFLAGVSLVSWLSWAGYGRYYERGQVDLLREQG